MKAVVRYFGACAALVAVTAGALSLWLTPGQVRGLATAGGAALVLQTLAFALMLWARKRTNRFLAVWAGGTLVRFAAVGLAAWVVIRWGELDPAATLLGLAGYLFVMLLLEPAFLASGPDTESTRTV